MHRFDWAIVALSLLLACTLSPASRAGETTPPAGFSFSPENPKGTRWSAYRDYGRFGAVPTTSIKSGESLTLQYRFLVADCKMAPTGVIEKSFDQFTGAKEPSAEPNVTALPAERSGEPKTKPAKPVAGK